MYAENLEAAEEVIRRLFDPRLTYKKAYISPEIKLAYLQHYLESRWTEIVGENLARSSAIEKISGSEHYVRTANSMLDNELYMMQQLFLQKINSFLLGRVLIKKVYFHTGSFFRKQQQKEKQAELQIAPVINHRAYFGFKVQLLRPEVFLFRQQNDKEDSEDCRHRGRAQ